jgi:hypothetical protein
MNKVNAVVGGLSSKFISAHLRPSLLIAQGDGWSYTKAVGCFLPTLTTKHATTFVQAAYIKNQGG